MGPVDRFQTNSWSKSQESQRDCLPLWLLQGNCSAMLETPSQKQVTYEWFSTRFPTNVPCKTVEGVAAFQPDPMSQDEGLSTLKPSPDSPDVWWGAPHGPPRDLGSSPFLSRIVLLIFIIVHKTQVLSKGLLA